MRFLRRFKELMAPSNLQEFNVDQWKGLVSSKTLFWRSERNKFKGVESRVAKLGDYIKKDHIALFLTEPTYTFDAKAIENGKYMSRPKKQNLYVMKIKFEDLEKEMINLFQGRGERAPEKAGWDNINLKIFRGLMRSVDVSFDCSCMSFTFQGHRYKLSKIDAAIYPTAIPDPVWGPRHQHDNGLCKHLIGLVRSLKFFAPLVYREIKK